MAKSWLWWLVEAGHDVGADLQVGPRADLKVRPYAIQVFFRWCLASANAAQSFSV